MTHNCNICKKKYSSYNSLWLHNKKFHSKQENKEVEHDDSKIKCEYCNKFFYSKYTLKTHHYTCSIKNYKNISIIPTIKINTQNKEIDSDDRLKLKIKLIELEKEKIIEEKEVLKLKLQLKLKSNQNITNIKNNNNIININNQLSNTNINNTFKILSIGRENLEEILSIIEKKTILNSRYNCIEEMVDIVHCGKYDQFKNILITNLKDKYAYKFDNNLNKFVCINKNEIIRDLVSERLDNIREIYEELSTTNKINDSTKKLVKEFLDKMITDDKYIEDSEGTIYKNFRSYKEHRVKILIYNNLDKISKDLAIILDKPFDNILED